QIVHGQSLLCAAARAPPMVRTRAVMRIVKGRSPSEGASCDRIVSPPAVVDPEMRKGEDTRKKRRSVNSGRYIEPHTRRLATCRYAVRFFVEGSGGEIAERSVGEMEKLARSV